MFAKHISDEAESSQNFMPKFDTNGFIPCITSDAVSGEVLMFAFMNEQALRKTLETGVVHYWSRSRNQLWQKGETSGEVQNIVEIRTDCDQDVLWIKAEISGRGAACHLGYRSCFFRKVDIHSSQSEKPLSLHKADMPKLFDPDNIYRK